MNNYIDERKNFRFPIFDDNTPVKQADEYTRVILQEEYPMDLQDDENYTTDTLSDEYGNRIEGESIGKEGLVGADFADYEYPEQLEINYTHDIQEDGEDGQPQVFTEKPNFKNGHKAIFQQKDPERIKPMFEPIRRDFLNDSQEFENRETSLANRFTPKHIPESHNRSFEALAKEQKNKDELLLRFEKPEDSYLLMENGEVAAEVVDVPEVTAPAPKMSFKKDTTDIPFTRREFKKLSEKEKGNVELPSESHQKNSNMSRSNRLERGLKGILAEEASQELNTRYFE